MKCKCCNVNGQHTIKKDNQRQAYTNLNIYFTSNAKIRSVQSFDLTMLSSTKIQPDHNINMIHVSMLEQVVTGTRIGLHHCEQITYNYFN